MSAEPRPAILNANHDQAFREETTRVLTQEGFEVKEAETGADALRLAANLPDLILLGVHLPDLSGLEVCCRLKQDPRTCSIPVVHLSSVPVSPASRTAALECGADAFLTHPIEPGLLVATIRALLRARHAENEARESERIWRTTFDAISHGVCLIDASGIVRQVNRSICALLGRPPEELIGRQHDAFFESIPRPEQGWVFDRVKRTLQQESYDLEVGERWFHITADPLLGRNGEFAGAVRTVIDITERKRADEERDRLMRQLESERARLEAVLRQMPAGVIMAEAPSGKLVLRNEQVEAIFRGPFRTGGMEDYLQYPAFHSDGSAYKRHEMPLARTVASGEAVTNEEILFTRADGSRATVLVSSVPIRNREGYVVAAMAVLHDVSERHELESQLRRSQKMEAMGRLAGGAAHDFNNLLTIIGGYGQMALDALGPKDPLRTDLEAILEASARASALTRQLLTFSRRQMVQPKTLDLNRNVTKVSRMLRRVIGEDIRLVTSLTPAQTRIRLDPAQLEQVLLNIAVNARDAMPTGGVLNINTEVIETGANGSAPHTLEPGRYVRLSISDTGTGMTPETLSHLFEPFYTTKAKGKGTGLGLSTVYGAVKQGGGEIAVESEPGRGTTFRIYFPASGDKVRDNAAAPAAREGSAETGTETVLLVEDEPEVRRLASQMLTRQGYAVLEAGSGADALRIWKQHRDSIDLVLTDVIMPQMSGPQMVEQLKALSPEVKVLYMSGYTDDVLARHGVVETKMALLHKPFTLDKLAAMVRSVLDARETR